MYFEFHLFLNLDKNTILLFFSFSFNLGSGTTDIHYMTRNNNISMITYLLLVKIYFFVETTTLFVC